MRTSNIGYSLGFAWAATLLLVVACSNLSSDSEDAGSSERPTATETSSAPPSPPSAIVVPQQSGGGIPAAAVGSNEPSGATVGGVEGDAPGAAVEEVVVTGARPAQTLQELLEQVERGSAQAADHQERLERFRSTSSGSSLPAGQPGDAALTRVQPGEEVWIIRKARSTVPLSADEDSPGTGVMLADVLAENADDTTTLSRRIPLPLEHTDVNATITGYISTVDVTQQFSNPFSEKIEAVYLFPLPEKAAVTEFVMTIGERHIRGILREREQAEQLYAEARAQGYQATLLTQHRPNIFEQKVANIEPGKRIDVDIRYFHTLAFEDGWYSFVFPTVVGPRYNPPGSTDPIVAVGREATATTPTGVRYLTPGERSGHDISIRVDIEPGVAIEDIRSSHRIARIQESPERARVELAEQAVLPNRDFVLDFKVTGERVKSSLLTYVDPASQEGYFTMMLYPPSGLTALRRLPLELVFVLDCSGSMGGQPIAQAKAAILAALDRLEPNDTFQIIRFSSDASAFGRAPVAATRDNIERAARYVRTLQGSGGTQMIEGIKAALDFPHDDERLRFVTFLTDGFIGNEVEILGAIHRRLGVSRIFSFGVGSSTNRYLLERMASVGRGAVAYLGLEDSGQEVMDFFFDRISHPAMIDIEIDWNGMRVADVYPSRLPDLFVGRSVVVTGRFEGPARVPTVRGRAAGQSVAYTPARSERSESQAFIAKSWARLRIADLADRRAWAGDSTPELVAAIRTTALKHGLMSDYTAFVAVDASQRTAGDHGTTVYQAVPVPRGVRYETTVGQTN